MDSPDLTAYLDGQLTTQERADVERALADSADLSQELAELTAVRSSLRDLPEVEPPAGFFEAMLERGTADPGASLPDGVASLSVARGESKARAERKKRSLSSRVTSIVAAAAVFLLVLGFGSGISAVERVPALDDFASRHAEALAAMESGSGAETDRFVAVPMDEMKDIDDMAPSGGQMDFDMMGAYEGTDANADKVLQFVYSDPTGNVISIFRQDGYVAADDMPAAETMKMDGDDAWHLTEGDFDTLVVDRDGVTFTVMGGLDSGAAMESIANDLPETDLGAFAQVQNVCRKALDSIGL